MKSADFPFRSPPIGNVAALNLGLSREAEGALVEAP